MCIPFKTWNHMCTMLLQKMSSIYFLCVRQVSRRNFIIALTWWHKRSIEIPRTWIVETSHKVANWKYANFEYISAWLSLNLSCNFYFLWSPQASPSQDERTLCLPFEFYMQCTKPIFQKATQQNACQSAYTLFYIANLLQNLNSKTCVYKTWNERWRQGVINTVDFVEASSDLIFWKHGFVSAFSLYYPCRIMLISSWPREFSFIE